MANLEDLITCNPKSSKQQIDELCGKETMCKLHVKANASYCFCPFYGFFITKTKKCGRHKVPVVPAKHELSVIADPNTSKIVLRFYDPNSTTSFPFTSFPTTSFPSTNFSSTSFPSTNFSSTNFSSANFSSTYTTPHSTISTKQNGSVINVTEKFVSQNNTKTANFFNGLTDNWLALIVALFVFLVASILVFSCSKYNACYRFGLKKKKSNKNKNVVVSLDKNVMQDQRYTTNPQYSIPVPAIDVPIGSIPSLNRNSITNLEKIGEGFFGEVYKGQLHSIDNEEERVETVAVKRLKRTANVEALEDFLREVEIISSFNHPNILTLVGVCQEENGSPPWMVFEYMSFGDLADVLRNSNREFRDDDRESPILEGEALLSISSQIAAGMEYLAAQRFVHRDLACRNCLVGSGLTVKISDFGMSRDIYTCDYYRVGGNRMLPVRWMSPESLGFGKFTLESDVWSYGVVLWEIYSYGKQPYFGYTNEQVMRLISDHILLDIPENCPNEIADIMRSCWQTAPKNRIQFLDICNRLSALKDCIDEIPVLPRPPPMPITINYPIPFGDDEFDDMMDEDNYLRPTSTRSSIFLEPSNSSLKPSNSSFYLETLP